MNIPIISHPSWTSSTFYSVYSKNIIELISKYPKVFSKVSQVFSKVCNILYKLYLEKCPKGFSESPPVFSKVCNILYKCLREESCNKTIISYPSWTWWTFYSVYSKNIINESFSQSMQKCRKCFSKRISLREESCNKTIEKWISKWFLIHPERDEHSKQNREWFDTIPSVGFFERRNKGCNKNHSKMNIRVISHPEL
jgi:hypothetical protein